jgi:hypothetical protein
MRRRTLFLSAVALTVAALAAACAHTVAYDPYLATIDVQSAANEAADDAGLNLYFGYECELDADPHDSSRFTVNCQTSTGDGKLTTMTGRGQADSSRHYHGRFVIAVEGKPVVRLTCLGSEEEPRC